MVMMAVPGVRVIDGPQIGRIVDVVVHVPALVAAIADGLGRGRRAGQGEGRAAIGPQAAQPAIRLLIPRIEVSL